MSKKFKGKTCVYCGIAPSSTADHVIAREFFLEKHRDQLPKVPACGKCNREKSYLEHYLTAILPFGGQHPDARINLETMVPRRLRRNAKLYSELSLGLAEIEDAASPDGVATTLPIDSVRLEQLFALIAKGLAWHHWQVLLAPGYSAISAFLMNSGISVVEQAFARAASNRITVDLGDGTFLYDALQDRSDPTQTIWKFSVYGGESFGGDPTLPGQKASQIVAVTGAQQLIEDLQRIVFGQAPTP